MKVGGRASLPAPSVAIRRTTLEASTGVAGRYSTAPPGSGSVTLEACTVVGTYRTVDMDSGYTAKIAASQLSGGPTAGAVTCVGVYDEAFSSPGYGLCP
jgi:hypothetical protein